MRRIRIGKDVNVKWVLHAPADVVFTAENLTIEMKDPKGRSIQCEYVFDSSVSEGYAVIVSLKGIEFNILGNYSFSAWLNKGLPGQSVVDAVNAFTLVESTLSEDKTKECGCGHLMLETVDIQSDFFFIGPKGEKGDEGFSPTINAIKSGNTTTVYIQDKYGSKSFSIKDGEKGENGQRGEKGEKGETGNKGEKGDKGDTGRPFTYNDFTPEQLAYLKGEKGDKGDKGDRGEQGIQGIQGLQGVQGEKGDKGDKGDTGATGANGQDGQNGRDGVNGTDGQDGYSPTVSVSKSGKVTTITITDKNGEHTATITDGNDGQNGQDGANGRDGTNGTNGTNGQDGVSPTVEIDPITGGHQVTFKDATHPQGQSFNVMDGNDVTEIFWATYGTTTATEIQTALDAGKVVMCNYSDRLYMYSRQDDTKHILACASNLSVYHIIVRKTDSVYSASSQPLDSRINSTSATVASDLSYYTSLRTKNMIDAVDAKVDRPWVKIADETLAEDTSVYAKGDTTGRLFDKVKIVATFVENPALSSNTSAYIILQNAIDSTTINIGSSTIKPNQGVRAIAEVDYDDAIGGWGSKFRVYSGATINEDGNNVYTVGASNIRKISGEYANKISIYSGRSQALVTGTKIEIWVKYVVD